MREILFRGKRKDNNKWVYGCYAVIQSPFTVNGEPYKHLICDGTNIFNHEIYPETLGQYTGYKDRSGMNIFEGDILQGEQYPFRSNNDYNYFAEVIWFENSPAFGIYTFKNPVSKVSGISTGNCEYMENWESSDWVVIGNIHDNPKLLKIL